MVEVRLDGVTKTYSSPSVTAVRPTDITIEHGEFFTLVGPSGCGKTTMLRMIAGLETPTEGEIYFDGERVTDLPPQQRDIAMVFQNIALYPHMSVRDNIGYGLKVRNETENMDEKVEEAAELLSITNQLDKRPSQLSGGQQQRVALGRAIVRDPHLILLDEPMSDLDAKLKSELRVVVQELHKELDTTLIYVTHDQKEAMTMSTKVGLLQDGEFVQVSPPNRLYDSPEHEFAGTFIGQPSMNILEATLDDNGTLSLDENGSSVHRLDISKHASRLESQLGSDRRIRVGFRPQHIVLTADPTDGLLELDLNLVEQDGDQFNLYTTTKGGDDIIAVMHEHPDFDEGSSIGIVDIRRFYLFDPDSGEKILQVDTGDVTTTLRNAD